VESNLRQLDISRHPLIAGDGAPWMNAGVGARRVNRFWIQVIDYRLGNCAPFEPHLRIQMAQERDSRASSREVLSGVAFWMPG
jgi:hypothetical protein